MSVHTDKTFSRFQPGTALPIRIAENPVVPDTEKPPPPYYKEFALTRIMRALDKIGAMVPDLTRIAEEYAGESSESPTGETTLMAFADYEPAAELITEVLVTGIPNFPFTLQLGDKYLELYTDAKGICLLSPVMFKLGPAAKRILTVGTPTTVSQSNAATNTAPAANANLSIITGLNPSSIYQATAYIGIEGTPADGTDNFNAVIIGATSINLANNITGMQTFGPFAMQPTVNGDLIIQTKRAATAGAVYNTTLALAPLVNTQGETTPGSWFLHLGGHALSSRKYG